MSRILRWYLSLLEKHPWKTQSVTTGVILASGDLLCQVGVEKRHPRAIDPWRVARFGLVGAAYVGPGLRGWYIVLEKLYGRAGRTVGLKKMITDQALFAPAFLGGILSLNALLRGESLNDVKSLLRRDYVDVIKVNYMIWPGTQLITFYIIPFQHRVLFVNFVALIFNIYLSWKTNAVDATEINEKEINV